MKAIFGTIEAKIFRIEAEEELSTDSQIVVSVSVKAKLFPNIIGTNIRLDLVQVQWNGIISGIQSIKQNIYNEFHYILNISSLLFYYCQYKRYDLYVNMELADILTKILKKYPIPFELKFNIKHNYSFLIQYGQSDYTMIQHLTSRHNIFYYYDYVRKIYIFSQYLEALPEPIELAFSDNVRENPLNLFHNYVYSWNFVATNCPANYTTFWFNPDNPNVRAQATGLSQLEHAEGEIQGCHEGRGPTVNMMNLSNQIVNSILYKVKYIAITSRPDLHPGSVIQIKNLDGDALYYIYKISHKYSLEEMKYSNEGICIPIRSGIEQIYRPMPEIQGFIIATVAGQDEKILDTVEGKIRLKFSWAEQESGHIPVGQAAAGNGYGSMFLPRPGQRVLVGFERGDPTCPFIIGAFYDASHKPAYAESYHNYFKTKNLGSGASGHEVVFSDEPNREKIELYSSGNFNAKVKSMMNINIEQSDLNLGLNSGNLHCRLDGEGSEARLELPKGQVNLNIGEGNYQVALNHGNFKLSIIDGQIEIDAPRCTISSAKVVLQTNSLDINSIEEINLRSKQINLN